MANNNYKKFKLLLWKNFLLQKRHPLQSMFEILAPVFFASILVIIRDLVEVKAHPITTYWLFETTNQLNYTLLLPWSPYNPALKWIIENALGIINRKEPNDLRSVPLRNSKSLNEYFSKELNLETSLAGIEFEDSLAGNKDVHPQLEIKIRFPSELRFSKNENWRTNQLFPFYQVEGPRDWNYDMGASPRYWEESFLMLQQQISYAVIRYHLIMKGDNDTMDKLPSLLMRRFPFPKWEQDNLLTGLEHLVGFIIMLSFVYTCISTVKVVTVEKQKQLKEAMKIMGLPNWCHWMAWFIKQFMFLSITTPIIVFMVKAKWHPETSHAIFTKSNPFVILLFLQLYAMATITFCFAISVFFTKANDAATVAGVVWFITYFPFQIVKESYNTMSLFQKLAACIFSNSAMALGFSLIVMWEGKEDGLQFHNIWKTTNPDDNLTLVHLMAMLIFDSLFYLIIAIYVEGVYPGEYGIPRPWYFPFQRSYWRGNRVGNVRENSVRESVIENELYEKEPTDLEVGISIRKLGKKFSKKVVVNNLSLNMYKDQITVLLGHNGAGKTTTISMITGMLPPTSGTVIIEGYDIRTHTDQVRENIGFCPQHNILYDELTVEEHLRFYSALKGLEGEKIDDEVTKYLELLELEPKRKARSATLSGGMKRKLSMGIALCGNSKVVICDEPSAGMDPTARRSLWDVFQKLKKDRTILLTTHYMDEADLLGDRIAIMAHGHLQCCGSSFFLKKKYGAGYHLVLVKKENCNIQKVTNLLKKYVSNIHIDSNIGFELTYLLREEDASVFEVMLTDLEKHFGELGISSYGISFTTLEEVFMKVGTDKNQLTQVEDEVNDESIQNNEFLSADRSPDENVQQTSLKNNSRWGIRKNQIKAMLIKKLLSLGRSWILLLIHLFLPILLVTLGAIVYRSSDVIAGGDLPDLPISLNSYRDSVTVLTREVKGRFSQAYIDILEENDKAYINWEDANMTEKILEETERNTVRVRQRYIIGALFKYHYSEYYNQIEVWFNNEPYHSPPLALQMVTNAAARVLLGRNYGINFHNHPLPFSTTTKLRQLSKLSTLGSQLAVNLGFSMAYISAFYIMFYIKERVSQAKHLQFVSGISVLTFWGVAFICDIITFLFAAMCIITTIRLFDEDGYNTADQLFRLLVIFLLFQILILPYTYLASYIFNESSMGYSRMIYFNLLTGTGAFTFITVIQQPELNLGEMAKFWHNVFILFPHYSLTSSIFNQNVIYSTHKLCDYFYEACLKFANPTIYVYSLTSDDCAKFVCEVHEVCCVMTKNYYDIETPGIGRNVITTIVLSLILIGVLLVKEYQFYQRLIDVIYSKNIIVPPIDDKIDDDVLDEVNKVANIAETNSEGTHLMLHNVTKYYKNHLAVNSICLNVDKSECFGLLGLNGAGKTTTFKMLTGDIALSYGDIWVNGLNIRRNKKEIFKLIGYCPQFDALFDDLTCRETLLIFSLLRGYSIHQSKAEAKSLAYELNFHQHLDKRIKKLSGGNKRKVSTAIALIGNTQVIYLDEPTAGMDVETRRYIWNIICKVRDSGKSILLTSHSMEECEALCTRIAIMVNGSFLCLGSIQHLKNKFSNGYVLTVKLKRDNAIDYDRNLEALEKFVQERFSGATIRERHQQLLTFYITDKSLPWSSMFGIMEKAKKNLNLEDYCLSQGSLEQVFLLFTKYQHEEIRNQE